MDVMSPHHAMCIGLWTMEDYKNYCNSILTIAWAIIGSRLDYANFVLAGISPRNIHRLQRVQNSL